MSGDDTSAYAPKSPDLSSFISAGPTQAPHLSLQPQAAAAPPPQPPPTHLQIPPHAQTVNHGVHPAQQYKVEQPAYGYGYGFDPNHPSYAPSYPPHSGYQPQQQQQQPAYLSPNQGQLPPQPAYGYGVQTQHQGNPSDPYGQQLGSLQSPHFAQAHVQPPYQSSYSLQHNPLQTPATQLPHTHIKAEVKEELKSEPDMPPRKAAAPAPVIEPSPVKTKFPTARIKRIMQADEEVGKVAQQTPIAVGKALEMFMISMVSRSADVAKDKGSKRVTAQMLKQVVETDEQWDFLRDIVSRVEAEKEGSKSKAKVESDSDEDTPEPKKRGRGGRKKKT